MLAIVMLATAQIHSQTVRLRFDRITSEEGLSQNTVTCILQDRKGFMWFGTEDGLNRYDGYSFIVFRRNQQNPKSISGNYIRSLMLDHNGILWVGTRTGGVNKYDDATRSFLHVVADPGNPGGLVSNDVLAMLEDRSGKLWFGTANGLDEYDPQTNRFFHFRHDAHNPESLSNDYVTALCEDHLGNLWVGTYLGLNRFAPAEGAFVHYVNKGSSPQLLNDIISSIYEDRRGDLWVGTMGGGFNLYDRAADQFKPFSAQNDRGHQSHMLENDFIHAIMEDHLGVFWVGTEDGLVRFDRQKEIGYVEKNNLSNYESIGDNFVACLYEDRSMNLWVGTASGGINKVNRKAKQFFSFTHDPNNPSSLSADNVLGVCLDHGGTLWVGTWLGGLNRYDARTKTFKSYVHDVSHPERTISSTIIYSMYEDSRERFWIGTAWGLNLLDRDRETFTLFLPSGTDSATRSPGYVYPNNIYSLVEDRTGVLRLATNNGLLTFDCGTKNWKKLNHNPADRKSLAHNSVSVLFIDAQGRFWVGTSGGGLDLFNPQNETFYHHVNDPSNPASISGNVITAISQSSPGTLWIGTTEGLNEFNPERETFRRYTDNEGLPNNVVQSIQGDDRGNLWIGTNGGLSKFNLQTKTFRNNAKGDGLLSNEFGPSSAVRSSDGMMYFGCIKGLLAFYPDSLQDYSYTPPVMMTSFLKFDEEAVLEKDIALLPDIVLKPKENKIAFEFASLDYSNSNNNMYAFKLEGFDRDWVVAKHRHRATYTNLDPGKYIFHVKGSNSDGFWSDSTVSVSITVTPPFWATWWFRSTAVIFVIAITAYAYYKRVSYLQKERSRERELARLLLQNQEDERKRIAGELHDSVGQNMLVIKNRVFLGLQPPEDLQKMKQQMEEISTAVSQTLKELREISYNLRPYELDRVGLTEAIKAMLDGIENSSTIGFETEVDSINALFSKEAEINIFRILQELCNNILKHSNATEATVIVKKETEWVQLFARDNGKGFDLRALARDSARPVGFGLAGMDERVRILNGRMEIRSFPGFGTSVRIIIPAAKSL